MRFDAGGHFPCRDAFRPRFLFERIYLLTVDFKSDSVDHVLDRPVRRLNRRREDFAEALGYTICRRRKPGLNFLMQVGHQVIFDLGWLQSYFPKNGS
jgi:hypothetical protein